VSARLGAASSARNSAKRLTATSSRSEKPGRPLALSLAAWLCCAPALAVPELPLFLPGEDERRSAEEGQLAKQLESAIAGLPGVVAAHVLLSLPRPAEVALDAPLPAPVLTVLLDERGAAPPAAALTELVQAAGRGPRAVLHVQRRSPAPKIAVGEATVPAAPGRKKPGWPRVILATSLLSNVLLATLVLRHWPRLRRWGAVRSKVS
jgi:hypothetical protein